MTSSSIEKQRAALLEDLTNFVQKIIPATQLMEQCVSASKDGMLTKDMAEKTAKVLNTLLDKLVKLVIPGLAKLEGDAKDNILNFVNQDFKNVIQTIVEQIELCVESKDPAILEEKASEFRKLPRQLIQMVRNAEFDSETDNKTTHSKTSSKTPTKSPKKANKKGESHTENGNSKPKKSTPEDSDSSAGGKSKGKGSKSGSKPVLKEKAESDESESEKSPAKRRGVHPRRDKLRRLSVPTPESDPPLRSPRAPGVRKDGSARPALQKIGRATALDRRLHDSGAKVPDYGKESHETSTSGASDSAPKNGGAKKHPRRRTTISGTARPRAEDIAKEMEKIHTKTSAHSKTAGDLEIDARVAKKPHKDGRQPRPVRPKPDAGVELENPISSFIGMATDPGKRYGKLNQDTHLYCRTGKFGIVAGVFDGHGVNGEVAAEISRDTFRQYFTSRDFWSYPLETRKSMLTEVFELSHQNIIAKYDELTVTKWDGHKFHLENVKGLMMYKNKHHGALLQDFGTTAVVAVINTDASGKVVDMMTANVGDSIAFIGRESTKNTVGLRAVHGLIDMHNGANSVEENRIVEAGSRLTDGDYIAPPDESGFGWAQLAVTRSLGHRYFSHYGVIATPFVCNYTVNKRDRYLVITSDGVTDVLSSREILKAIKEFRSTTADMQVITTKLVRHSLAMWKKRYGDQGEPADNSTAIVIDLKQIHPN